MATIPKGDHTFAAIFPMMTGDELRELAADIKLNGLNNPIWTFEGKVLDGRNRRAACELVKVRPYFEPFKGTEKEALAFVWSQNGPRRHLTTSQRAMAAAEMSSLSTGGQTPVSKREAAKVLNVSKSTVYEADEILKEGTKEEIEDVKTGKADVKNTKKKIAARKRDVTQTTKDVEIKDEEGQVIPPILRDVFGDPWLRQMLNDADKWIAQVGAKSVASVIRGKSTALGAFCRGGDAMKELALAVDALAKFREHLAAGLPYCVCPKCEGKKGGCTYCRKCGWMPEWRFHEVKTQQG